MSGIELLEAEGIAGSYQEFYAFLQEIGQANPDLKLGVLAGIEDPRVLDELAVQVAMGTDESMGDLPYEEKLRQLTQEVLEIQASMQLDSDEVIVQQSQPKGPSAIVELNNDFGGLNDPKKDDQNLLAGVDLTGITHDAAFVPPNQGGVGAARVEKDPFGAANVLGGI